MIPFVLMVINGVFNRANTIHKLPMDKQVITNTYILTYSLGAIAYISSKLVNVVPAT
jgi:predicted membrane channel-forming protein YqfA (hemolysin III family)